MGRLFNKEEMNSEIEKLQKKKNNIIITRGNRYEFILCQLEHISFCHGEIEKKPNYNTMIKQAMQW